MHRPLRHYFAVFVISAFACAPSFAVSPDGLTDVELKTFLFKLQTSVSSGHASAVAPLISFPLRVNEPHHKHLKVSAHDFPRQFSSIFTPAVVSALVHQKPETMFRSYRGAMVGDGEVWISGICLDSSCGSHKGLVIAVNVP
jgi:hypothetical protein